MKIGKEISYDEVVWEWLSSEWYKSHFVQHHKELSHLVTSPDFTNEKENSKRKEILQAARHDMVAPLERLKCVWHEVTIKTFDDYKALWINAVDVWYRIAGETFKLSEIPNNIDKDTTGNGQDILEKIKDLEEKKINTIRPILVGSSMNTLTIVEGKHKLAAIYMYMQKHNLKTFPKKAIVGLTPFIGKYRWSVEWEYFDQLLDLCKKEEESFFYEP